jgi:hypothetical protein
VVVNVLSEQGRLVKAHEHKIRQRYLHGKWRVDFLRTHYRYADGTEEIWESNGGIRAFASNRDGSGVRYYSSETHFGELKVPGGDPETAVKLLAPQLYETFKSHFYHETYWSMLAYRVPVGTVTYEEDSALLRLPATASSDPHNFAKADFVVHLSQKIGLPTLIRRGVNIAGNPDVISEFENEMAEVLNGIWAPVRSTRRVYSAPLVGNLQTAASENQLALDLSRSKFNIDIPLEVFELRFPPGTVVHEKASGENYVVSDGNQKDYQAYAKIAVQKAEELRSAKAHANLSRSNWLLPTLVVINLVGFIVVFSLFVFLRKSNRERSQ